MGREATCEATSGGRSSSGTARLETSAIQFRGAFRLDIPLAEITSVRVEGGLLEVQHGGAWTAFTLGTEAETWAERIRSPRSLIDKLGVKAGQLVVLQSIADAELPGQLAMRGALVVERPTPRPADVALLGVSAPADLRRLATLRRFLAPSGALWAVWAKGRKELNEDHIREAARSAGLVDVKVVAFSATHSALKLVVPRRSR